MSRPIVEHARYDLAFELGDRILRVQCKWGALDQEGALIKVRVGGSWLSPTAGYVRSSYTAKEIDLLAVSCGQLDRCYPETANGHALTLLPISSSMGL